MTPDKQIIYKPVYGREGKDTFNYTLRYQFSTDAGLQTEVAEAEVAIIVFCCDRTEFEVLCEGNQGTFKVLTATEKANDEVELKLINDAGDLVDRIEVTEEHFIEVQEIDGNFHEPVFHIDGDGIGVFGSAVTDTVYFSVTQ